jgi:hypothetical protein
MKLGLITMSLVMAGLFAHAQGEPAAPANTGTATMEQKAEIANAQAKKEKKHKKHGKAKADKAAAPAEGTSMEGSGTSTK